MSGVRAEDFSQAICYFADGCAGIEGFDERGHQVVRAFRRRANVSQSRFHLAGIALCAVPAHALDLIAFERWIDEPMFLAGAVQSLSQGTHLITVEYYSRSGGASAHLSWVKN